MELPALKDGKEGILLPLRVKPRGRKNAIEGVREGSLLVSVCAAPADGAANAAVIETLARALQLPKSSLQILRGHKSREKTIGVTGIGIEELAERLHKLLSDA